MLNLISCITFLDNTNTYIKKYYENDWKKENIMKKFVVKFGGIIVDIMAVLTLVGLVISTVMMIGSQGLWAGLSVLWAGLVSFIFVFFLIYLVMSINDKLSKIEDENYNR